MFDFMKKKIQDQPKKDSSRSPSRGQPTTTKTNRATSTMTQEQKQRQEMQKATYSEAKKAHDGTAEILSLMQTTGDGESPIEQILESLQQILKNQEQQTHAISAMLKMLSQQQKSTTD